MKKGGLSTHALMSIVIVVVMLALTISVIYSWVTQGSDGFTNLLNLGG